MPPKTKAKKVVVAKTKKTTISVPKKTITAKPESIKKEKVIGSIVQKPKIQTAAGWMQSHLKKKKK